jgi:hypothetical protein
MAFLLIGHLLRISARPAIGRQAAHERRGAVHRGGYRQPKFLEWRLTRLDGAGPDTPWYIGLGPHDAPAPVAVAKHC